MGHPALAEVSLQLLCQGKSRFMFYMMFINPRLQIVSKVSLSYFAVNLHCTHSTEPVFSTLLIYKFGTNGSNSNDCFKTCQKKEQNSAKSRIIKIFFKVFIKTWFLFPVSFSLKGRGTDVM